MSMRKGFCPECLHTEVIKTQVAEFVDDSIERPMCVTYDKRWVLGSRNPAHGHGELYTFTCRRCGFTQWFANRPQDIPIGEDFRTRLISGDANR